MTVNKKFMETQRGPCIIPKCGKDGVWHHFMPRNKCPMLHNHPEGGCTLCDEHHTYSNEIAPHSLNYRAVRAFNEFIATIRGEDWKDDLRALDRSLRNDN